MLKSKRAKLIMTLLLSAVLMSMTFMPASAAAGDVHVPNGVQFEDTSGNLVNAHGGGIIQVGSYYYWYGEHRDEVGEWLFQGVSCYRTTDFKNWEYRGDVLNTSSDAELASCNVERPKVIYNATTGKYVMWMHWENGVHYGEARCAVAWCDTPDGNFTYIGSFRPYQDDPNVEDHGLPGYMSRDCTLFVDDDGTAYFLSSSNENMDMNVYRLTSDYLDIDELVAVLWPGQQREAPCLFKRGSYYFLLTSGCTGWDPNQAKYAYSTSIASGWSSLINIGNSTTFYSQPAYVVTMTGTSGTNYLYMGDRWAGAWDDKVNDSRYVWAPLEFPSATSMTLSYNDALTINTTTAEISPSSYIKVVNDYTTGTSNYQFNFTGTWSAAGNEGSHNNDNHWTNVVNSAYEVGFNGTQVKVYGKLDTNLGIAAISIDGGAETMVDCYNNHPTECVILYTSPVLTQGQHTVKVRVTGNMNALSTNSHIIADRIDVYGVAEVPGSFSLSSPSNGARNISRTNTYFDWGDSSGASSYTILVDNNSDFSSPEISVSGLTASNYTSTVTLAAKTTYYWKVTAVNASGQTECNSVFSFKSANR